MPPIAWLRAVFGLMMRPAGDGRYHPGDAHRAEVGVDAHLDELRAEGVHRELLALLARLRLVRHLDGILAVTPEDVGVCLVRAASAASTSRPSPALTWSAVAPFKGEASSAVTRFSTSARAATAASWTAEPTLATVIEPPSTGAGGSRESPSSNRTWPAGRPSASAAICVITV